MSKRLLTRILIVTGIIGITAVGIVLQSDWRPSFSLALSGATVAISLPHADSLVFFDSKEIALTTTPNESVLIDRISKGEHTVLVAKDDSWPWIKTINVSGKEKIVLQSFNLPKTSDLQEISFGDEKYNEAWKLLLANDKDNLGNEESDAIISQDKNVAIWKENNNIFAKWVGASGLEPYYFCKNGVCNSRLQVASIQSNVVDVDFFPNRSDVLIFSSNEGLFVIEINNIGTQNFQPILRTQNPNFVLQNNDLYIRTGNNVRLVSLE